jgi:hypothetical protein
MEEFDTSDNGAHRNWPEHSFATYRRLGLGACRQELGFEYGNFNYKFVTATVESGVGGTFGGIFS